MQLSFSDLRTKEVINTSDGKKLGKVCDLVFCYPENRVLGIVVPGGKGFGFRRGEMFIDLKCITKLGSDVILVCIAPTGKQPPKKEKQPAPYPQEQTYSFTETPQRRSYEEYE